MSKPSEDTELKEIAEFRSEFRAWLRANQPAEPDFVMPQNFLFVETDQQFDYLREWQRKVYEAGYLGLDWPAEYGGGGDVLKRQRVVGQEMNRAGAPFFVNTIGLQWAGPVILQYGTEEQKRRFLKPILNADEIWCQGFSEPGAGSDLASVTTRAELDANGDYVVSGHKVWTTLGTRARWMILLARTDPDAHKYAGLSFFLFPMEAEGVEVLPLVKMTGEGGFNQVILNEAAMPADAMLGKPGQGWEVAMATLTFERGAAEGSGGGQSTSSSSETVRRVAELARNTQRDGGRAADEPILRDRLVQLWIEEEALRLGALRKRTPALSADRPMALALMNKLVYSEYSQKLSDLGCEVLGPEAALWMGDPNAPGDAEWPRALMNSFGMTIGGGTSEIQRNILGERVLGLPKSK